MDSKIQELTQKIYNEGVQKGNAEAEKIIAQAQSQHDVIVKDAEGKASQIIKDAEKQAQTLRSNTESELKLYADQVVESVKSAIADQISGDIVSQNVKAAVSDKDFMQKVILELVKNWDLSQGVEIKAPEADSLRSYFESNAKDLLDKGVEIKEVGGHATSFQISPKDGSYKIVFGENEFVELFKSFLRPQLSKMLF